MTDFYLLSEVGATVYKYDVSNDAIVFTKEIILENLIDDYYSNGMNLEVNLTADGYDNTVFIPSCGLEQIGSEFYYKSKNGMFRQLEVVSC